MFILDTFFWLFRITVGLRQYDFSIKQDYLKAVKHNLDIYSQQVVELEYCRWESFAQS